MTSLPTLASRPLTEYERALQQAQDAYAQTITPIQELIFAYGDLRQALLLAEQEIDLRQRHIEPIEQGKERADQLKALYDQKFAYLDALIEEMGACERSSLEKIKEQQGIKRKIALLESADKINRECVALLAEAVKKRNQCLEKLGAFEKKHGTLGQIEAEYNTTVETAQSRFNEAMKPFDLKPRPHTK